jgi:hypothetical protein
MESNKNQSKWDSAFMKSLCENSQLVFSKKLTISVIDTECGTAVSEIVDLQGIEQCEEELKNSSTALLTYFDNRTHFYKCLKENSLASVCIYFPMSREKYKLTCLVTSVSASGDSIKDISNKNQINSYLKKNFSNNKSVSKDEDIGSEDSYLTKGEEYFKKLYRQFEEKVSRNGLGATWNLLNNEDKLDYEGVHPDTIKQDVKLSDVDKFEPQEEQNCSRNFAAVFFIPVEVEHFIYPMPQVVANSRKPNFESLYKPHKKLRKYYFLLNLISLVWTVKELN